jgi:hypothetical protein
MLPPIITLENGRRVVKARGGKHIRIEAYALRSWNTLWKISRQLALPEIRRCLDAEWAGKKRFIFLRRLTVRKWSLGLKEELALLNNLVKRTDLRRCPKKSPAQIEQNLYRQWARMDAATDPLERTRARNYASALGRLLKRRTKEVALDQLDAARRGEKVEPGDHSHEGLQQGKPCILCKEVIER